MNGNFVYHNPTKLYFGPDSLNGLEKELKKYGPNILLNKNYIIVLTNIT